MTTKEIIAEQLSEIYGFSLEQVQTTAALITDAVLRSQQAPDDGDQFSW
jgi:hypothetical protein